MNIPSSIKTHAKQNKLVFFIGAGLSAGPGFPSWFDIVKGFLQLNVDEIEKSSDYISALDSEIMSPLEALDKLIGEKKRIYKYFEDTLNKNLNSDIHEKLGEISNKFVTTNFDSLIEDNTEIKTVITSTNAYNLSKIDTDEQYILKIHGDINSVNDCTIFTEDYEKIYNADTLAKFQLKKILSQNVCIFLGFSFNDSYVKELFDHINSLYEDFGKEHYILSKSPFSIKGLKNIEINDYSEINYFLDKVILELGVSDSKKANKEDSRLLTSDGEILIDKSGSDTPPIIDFWVGRKNEIKVLESEFKVVFVTGIGGEGKSALAAHFINNIENDDADYLIDWRDFKEEDHNFQCKLLSMINLVSGDVEKYSDLVGKKIEDLIDVFFKELGDKKGTFVFDNIDSYIDLEKFEPSGDIGVFFNSALNKDHNVKFIFTCRPFIRYAGVNFHQLTLGGLDSDDVLDLLKEYKVPIKKEKLNLIAKRSHALTNGHALWINLILAQARRGEREVNNFLSKIEDKGLAKDETSLILSEKILSEIWLLLNNKQKTVLRTLAESVTSECEEDIAEIVSSELNYNQCSKALNALKNLNLIIKKGSENFIELHPLVKEFIRVKFPRDEQYKYISLFINYYDKFVVLLKPKLSHTLGFTDFQNWSNKIELYINSNDYQKALDSLREINTAINAAGYTEEYVRLVILFFSSITWSKKWVDKLNSFNDFFDNSISTCIEYGEIDKSTYFIDKLDSIVDDKTDRYVLLLSIRTYLNWFLQDYKASIKCGQEAEYLLNEGHLEDKYAVKSRLYLSLRDTKHKDNINKALSFYSSGLDLNEIVSSMTVNNEIHGSIYGNIGRCFEFLGENNKAIICISKSYKNIKETHTANKHINVGYASYWLYQLLKDGKNVTVPLYFLIHAINSWKCSSPPLANKIKKELTAIVDSTTKSSITSLESWQIEKYCNEWVNNTLSNNSIATKVLEVID